MCRQRAAQGVRERRLRERISTRGVPVVIMSLDASQAVTLGWARVRVGVGVVVVVAVVV